MQFILRATTITLFSLTLSVTSVSASIIDLNDFFADPSVTVAFDGSNALMEEDVSLGLILLANDPGLGDLDVIIPGPGVLLKFDFSFLEPLGNDDEFGAFVVDANTGLSAGASFEFFTGTESSGTITFDLSSLTGQTLGMQFQLNSNSNDQLFTSTVEINDLRLEERGSVVPEPSTLLVWGTLLSLVFTGRFGRRTRIA